MNIEDFESWFNVMCSVNKGLLSDEEYASLLKFKPLFEECHKNASEALIERIEKLEQDIEDVNFDYEFDESHMKETIGELDGRLSDIKLILDEEGIQDSEKISRINEYFDGYE